LFSVFSLVAKRKDRGGRRKRKKNVDLKRNKEEGHLCMIWEK
jgi:hypothetical protein